MDSNANTANHANAKPSQVGALINQVLASPMQLRVLLLTTMFGVWYFALYAPLTAQIDGHVQRSEKERKRLETALEIERLRAQVSRFDGRIPKNSEPNEWVQYMMNGVRGFDLRLVNFDTAGVKDIGPIKAIVLKVEVEGDFHEIDAFLRWVEGNPRLFRVDQLKLEPERKKAGKLDAHLVLLGVMS